MPKRLQSHNRTLIFSHKIKWLFKEGGKKGKMIGRETHGCMGKADNTSPICRELERMGTNCCEVKSPVKPFLRRESAIFERRCILTINLFFLTLHLPFYLLYLPLYVSFQRKGICADEFNALLNVR
ncbi:hypothetical protein POVWA2_057460 [Plasmodium ovale wallikeri]|uniref:Uncharacterized protein n=1 Tax=Plasmodium ovale wallikeri TaxID=864142 RepID=A0A1A8ZY33_PLAOA|nr:hypothetical protein POVWA1_058110 [Plasmodium ovale wallikeri]SBT49056.1 hypothetical protein POVWA2_057460 [Plasmodium ovale wallikeri]